MKCFFNDALSTFLIRLYGAEHLINYLSDCERETTTEIGRKGMFLFYDTLYIYLYMFFRPSTNHLNQKPKTNNNTNKTNSNIKQTNKNKAKQFKSKHTQEKTKYKNNKTNTKTKQNKTNKQTNTKEPTNIFFNLAEAIIVVIDS